MRIVARCDVGMKSRLNVLSRPRPLLSTATAASIIPAKFFGACQKGRIEAMSIDKSLRRKNQLVRSRNVLTRGERIKVLQDEERWQEGRSPYNLPKVRVLKMAKKPKKAAKEEEKPAEEGAAPAAAPAAETKAAKK